MLRAVFLAAGIVSIGGCAFAQSDDVQEQSFARASEVERAQEAKRFHERLLEARRQAISVRGRVSSSARSTAVSERAISLYDTEVFRLFETDPLFRRAAEVPLDSLEQGQVSSSVIDRIFFGEATAAFSSVAALYHVAAANKMRFACSGVLIDERIVLTAAHCLCRANSAKTQSIDAVYFINGKNWQQPKQYAVERVAALAGEPEDFCKERYWGKDLALLLLESGVQDRFDRAQLISAETLSSLKQGWVAGYGLNEGGPYASFVAWQDNLYSKERRVAQIAIATVLCDTEIGGLFAKDYYGCYRGRELVAGDFRELRSDACFGDSGGPLLAGSMSDYRVAAIVSRSVTKAAGKSCGPGTIYTPLDQLNQAWIRDCVRAILNEGKCSVRN